METIVDLVLIHLHFDKISRRHYLQTASLPQQHILNSFLDKYHSKKAKPYCLAIACLTSKQHLKIESLIVDTNNYLNGNFLSFHKLYKELSPVFYLVDMFSNHFFFYIVNCKDADTKNAHHNKLNKIYEESLQNLNTILIISDTSVKNNIVTSILYIQRDQNIIAKTAYYVINIISTEMKLFSIRCVIDQAVQVPNIDYIIVITYVILAIRCIFDSSVHLFQLHYIMVLQDLRVFFNKNSTIISFWDCLSDDKEEYNTILKI